MNTPAMGTIDTQIHEGVELAQKKLVEHNALVQAIEMGQSQETVMAKFGIKTPAALKTAYYNALVALEKIPGLNNTRKKKDVGNTVKINSRGSLVLPKPLVEALELSPDDQFKVEKNGNGLTLDIVKRPPKTILKKKAAPKRK